MMTHQGMKLLFLHSAVCFMVTALVLTSAKCWTTLELTEPIPEQTLYELCDIKLLYIEPRVFGELKIKLAMPPTPKNTVIRESARAIIDNSSTANGSNLEPIDLSVIEHAPQTEDQVQPSKLATGNNTEQVNRMDNIVIMNLPTDPYVDAPLSGNLDKIHNDELMDTIMSVMAQLNNESQDKLPANVPEFPNFTETDPNTENLQSIKECMVHGEKLSFIDMEAWLKNNDDLISTPEGRYDLRQRSKPVVNMSNINPLNRCAKQGVSYALSSDSSHDSDDITVKPGRWNKPQKQNIYVPVGGPSHFRIAAQQIINQ